MAIRGLRIDEPASGPEVAVDAIGSPAENYQIVKTAFGPAGTATLATEASPLPSRDYHGGVATFDSARRVVPTGAPASIGVDFDGWIDVVLFVNLTDAAQRVSIEDGDGNSYGAQVLDPNEWRAKPLAGLKFSGGIKVGSDNAASVAVQVKGTR